jgi:hypothetical protein
MRTFCCALIFLFAHVLTTPVHAELILPDELFDEYLLARKSIAAGEDRGAVLIRLRQGIERHPKSPHLELATRLAGDLAESIERAAARTRAGRSIDEAPAEFLSETQFPLYLVAFYENRQPHRHERARLH